MRETQKKRIVTDQSTIVWTLKTKSLLSSPAYRRQALQKGVPRFAGFVKGGLGEIFGRICLLFYYRLLSNSKIFLLRLWLLPVGLSLLCFSATGYADIGDILLRFQPYITVEETYDSNVFLTPNNEKDDFITAVSLGLRFSTRRRSETTREFLQPSATEEEKYGVDLDFRAIPTFYAKKTSDDYLALAGNLDTWYTWDRRLTFRVRDNVIRSEEPLEQNYTSTALPGQILLGSQRGRAIYYRNVFQPSAEYRFGREDNISINYINNIYRNENPSFEDSQQNYINPALNYWFDIRHGIFLEYALDLGDFQRSPDMTGNLGRGRYIYRFNPRTSIFGEYTYQKRDFDPQTASTVNYEVHTPALGFEHAFSRTLSVRAKGGYFWETQKVGSGENGPFYDILFTQRAQRTTYTLGFQGGYTEDYFSAENLGFAKYHQVIGTVTHQLTQRASVTFSGRYQRPEYNDGRTDNLWGGGGIFSYQLLRWLTPALDLSYRENHSNRELSGYKDFRGIFRITASY
ncbi:MAG: outer membrane beta-barrel protein [Deltaproteobacteria bacterium]